MNVKISLVMASLTLTMIVKAQEVKAPDTLIKKVETPKEEKKSHWYEKISIRGYCQVRYNRFLETNPKLVSEQGDKSIGDKQGLFMRRMRIIFFGQLNDYVYMYIQPDFASSASSTALHFAQIRDAYFDVSLDKKREFRFRIGQSKVPFGFENMQSSQNRLPLDRNDALNSPLSNERDMGVFFYYAPKKIRERFSMLVNDGLKGSGDYGVLGFGVYNGQVANKPELNNNLHWVARLAYPFKIGNQIIEPSVQAFGGFYTMASDQLSAASGTRSAVKTTTSKEYTDNRYAATFVLYPKPFGIQFEYNVGTGPQYDAKTDSILNKELKGGYVTLSYMTKIKNHILIPFVRATTYEGGKKHELDARSYVVNDIEVGVEWQPWKNFELVAEWMYSDRTTSDRAKENNYQFGSLLRLQAQLNF